MLGLFSQVIQVFLVFSRCLREEISAVWLEEILALEDLRMFVTVIVKCVCNFQFATAFLSCLLLIHLYIFIRLAINLLSFRIYQ
jgi:hypothetical protein